MAQLTQLGVRTVIVCGESTSSCVRASSAYSNGFVSVGATRAFPHFRLSRSEPGNKSCAIISPPPVHTNLSAGGVKPSLVN
jgi:hypothetical protein